MTRYKIIFSYDGTSYAGYQKQPGRPTIQEKLEQALQKINNGQKTILHASGRTDKGVHALGQVAHFDLSIAITEVKLKRALNSNLPADIHVIKVAEVEDDFHARYHVTEKTYTYLLNLGEYNPIDRNHVFQCCHSLNTSWMKKACTYLEGTHDYRAFVTENKDKENCTRTIFEAKIEEIADQKYQIIFRGTGFLRYQVRNMVGLLIKIGEEKIPPEKMAEILESKDRTKAGSIAPAEGLYLVEVKYEKRKG